MNGGEQSVQEQAREAERESQRATAVRKVTQQWARLGFAQAKFASEFWYVTPSRLGLKTKGEVSDLRITEMPERQPIAELDKPLIAYLPSSQDAPLAEFETEIRRHVAKGANLDRSHALIRAVMNGVTSEAHLGLLVRMGANPSGADEHGETALHATAHLIGGHEATRAGAVTAAKTLVGLGANPSAKNVYGDTALHAVLKQMRHYKDFDGAFGGLKERHWQLGRDDEKQSYQLLLVLLDPTQRAELIGGVLTPRQDYRLRFYAETRGDMARDSAPEFQTRVPLPSEHMDFEVPMWTYIPKSVRAEEVYKSFVYGWIQVLEAIKEIHSPRANHHAQALPTIDAVTRELLQGRYRYDDRYTNFFLGHGGKVEFAIDGLLDLTEASEEFFDVYFGDYASEGASDEYEALPEHPLDDCWDFVRYHFLGPKGEVRKGPFE